MRKSKRQNKSAILHFKTPRLSETERQFSHVFLPAVLTQRRVDATWEFLFLMKYVARTLLQHTLNTNGTMKHTQGSWKE